MSTSKSPPLEIDPHLHARLGALARRSGASLSDLAESVLRSYVDAAERALGEEEEDERRWQRYLETGASIPAETVQSKLRRLAAEAARTTDPQ